MFQRPLHGIRCLGIAALTVACAGPSHATESAGAPIATGPPPQVLILVNGEAGSISVIDTTSATVTATIPVGGKVEAAALSGDGRTAFAALTGAIALVDLQEKRISRTIAIDGEASDILVAGDWMYVVQNIRNKGKVSLIDLRSGATAGTQAVADLAASPAMSPDGRRLFISHFFYEGRVTVLDARSLAVQTVARFEDGVPRLRISQDGTRLYAPNGSAGTGRVSVMDVATNRVTINIDVPGEPSDLAIATDGRRAYAPMFREQAIAIIDLSSNKLERTIAVEQHPIHIALSPDGSRAFITNNSSRDLTVLDTHTFAITSLALAVPPLDIVSAR